MKFKDFLTSFKHFLEASPREELNPNGCYVFLSDLHMGDGSKRDDLAPNRSLILASLEWYFSKGYILILNGDIEDLNKFTLTEIQAAWPSMYKLFNAFAQAGRLRKIIGNHDLSLLKEKDYPYPLFHSLTFQKGSNKLFVFHGHQASRLFVKYDYLAEFIVRYLAKPLRVKNTSIATNSRKRFATERRIYKAARELNIVTISGHTHRPLFESQSKFESLRWSLEELLREYAISDMQQRKRITNLIEIYKGELGRLTKRELKNNQSWSLYGQGPLLVPCLFNSGCATGKQGITALEIDKKGISLVHWATSKNVRPFIHKEALHIENISDDHSRYTLKNDHLDQIFTRIQLLGNKIPS